jgi:hypothetical protein
MKRLYIFIIILLFLMTILFYNYFNIYNLESFSLSGNNSTTTKKKEEDQFKYFRLLPEYNKFSDETRETMKKKLKEKRQNMSNDNLEKQISDWEIYATEDEAKIFNETGEWPLNNYAKNNLTKWITNNVNNDKNIKEEDKEKSIQKIYKEWVNNVFFSPVSSLLFQPMPAELFNYTGDDSVGVVKFITKTRTTSIPLPDKGRFNCGKSKNGTPGPVPYLNSIEIEEKNYPSLENSIPDFKFLQKPCNPCIDRCPFSYEGVINAPYAEYWGVSSQTGKAIPEEVK